MLVLFVLLLLASNLTPGTSANTARNEIDTLVTVGVGSPIETDIRYDAAGNLLFDGQFAYQYDAWNRLVQINQATIQNPGGPNDPLVVGFFVKHYTYDGLGRLIRTESPYPDPAIGAATGQRRSERYYYDGIRRIQEVLLDPVAETDMAAQQGDPAALAALAANPDLDGDVATLGTENSQLGAESGSGGGPPPGSVLNREYVWGPGDHGVDELLVQYDINRAPTWPLQDAGLDAIALCDLGGGTPSGFPNGTGRLIWQGTYDAYGSVLTADPPASPLVPHLRAGHKGLFFDRLDVGVVNPSTGYEQPRLAPGAKLLGYALNRGLLCDLGRWLQRDPNASGMDLVTETAFHGSPLGLGINPFGLEAMYVDGANLFQYMGSSGWNGLDPLGLSWEDAWEDAKYGAEFGWNAFLTVSSFGDAGGMIGSVLESMISNYSMNLEGDVDWAMDWSQGDDWHSRNDNKWVGEAMVLGLYKHFNFEYWAGAVESASQGPMMAGSVIQASGRTFRAIAGAYKRLHAGMIFESYTMAKAIKAMKGLGSRWQAHHLLPYAWAKELSLNTNGPAVLLTKQVHQGYTTKLNNALKNIKNIRPRSRQRAEAQRQLRSIYGNDPEWVDAIEAMFK